MNSFTIKGRTYLNTNGTLRADQRIDGLKTGHTKEAGYCLAATENIIGNRYKNKSFPNSIVTADMRLIAVVFGCDSEEQRIAESLKLLDYGEKNFTYELLLSQNNKYEFKNELYGKGFIEASPGKELFLLKNKNEKYEISYTIKGSLPDKIKKGDLIGTAKLKSKTGMLEYTADLYASDNYNKVNIFKRMYIFINRVFTNFMDRLKLYF
jgi:D-alanyl-D-alanine carboxypeptidase (penicillin-binding protein 5/6)